MNIVDSSLQHHNLAQILGVLYIIGSSIFPCKCIPTFLYDTAILSILQCTLGHDNGIHTLSGRINPYRMCSLYILTIIKYLSARLAKIISVQAPSITLLEFLRSYQINFLSGRRILAGFRTSCGLPEPACYMFLQGMIPVRIFLEIKFRFHSCSESDLINQSHTICVVFSKITNSIGLQKSDRNIRKNITYRKIVFIFKPFSWNYGILQTNWWSEKGFSRVKPLLLIPLKCFLHKCNFHEVWWRSGIWNGTGEISSIFNSKIRTGEYRRRVEAIMELTIQWSKESLLFFMYKNLSGRSWITKAYNWIILPQTAIDTVKLNAYDNKRVMSYGKKIHFSYMWSTTTETSQTMYTF